MVKDMATPIQNQFFNTAETEIQTKVRSVIDASHS